MIAGLFALIAVLAIVGAILMVRSQPSPAQKVENGEPPQQQNSAANPDANEGNKQRADNRPQEQEKQDGYVARFFKFVRSNEKEIVALSTVAIAAFTIVLAFATAFLFVATRDLVHETEAHGQRSIRAYVSPVGAMVLDLDFNKPTEPFSARLVFKNSGQTPAYKFQAKGGASFQRHPLVNEELIGAENISGPGIVGPGVEYHLNVRVKALTQQQWQALLEGTYAVYIHGSYNYRDAFKALRTGKFRLYYGGQAGVRVDRALTFDSEGNEADED